MALLTAVQRACESPAAPETRLIQQWAAAAFDAGDPAGGDLELTVRIVDESEARELNLRYRGRDYVPNVLSFPMRLEGPIDTPLLGDVVLCAPVVEREAAAQHKSIQAHWSHLVVHGVLHCCGYDHETDSGALRMEALEKRILAEFGFPDPYTVHDEQ